MTGRHDLDPQAEPAAAARVVLTDRVRYALSELPTFDWFDPATGALVMTENGHTFVVAVAVTPLDGAP